MVKQLGHFIGGRRVVGESGRSGAVYNPATGTVMAVMPFASPIKVDAILRHPDVEAISFVGSTPAIGATAEAGPLVTRQAQDKAEGFVDVGVKEGAKVVVGGRGFRLQGCEKGCFLGGCRFDDVHPGMRIYRDEIFGPVLCVVRTDTYEEALRP